MTNSRVRRGNQELTVEEMVRQVLAKAMDDGLVSYARHMKHPMDMSAGELVGPANLLSRLLGRKDQSEEEMRCLT